MNYNSYEEYELEALGVSEKVHKTDLKDRRKMRSKINNRARHLWKKASRPGSPTVRFRGTGAYQVLMSAGSIDLGSIAGKLLCAG